MIDKAMQERDARRGVVPVDKVEGTIRDLTNVRFDEGDTISIPKDYQMYRQDINGNDAYFMYVETQDGKTKRFYPSSLAKMAMLVNKEGEYIGQNVIASGTAALAYQSYVDPNEAIDKVLAGRTIVFTKMTACRTLNQDNGRTRNTYVPQVDYVGAKKGKLY